MRLTVLVLASLLVPALVQADAPEAVLLPARTNGPLSGENALLETVEFSVNYPLRHSEDARKEASRAYLESRLAAYGYQVERHAYATGVNIIGILPGTTMKHEWISITSHYDTVPTTVYGTWDDGAGVGSAIEIARVAATQSWTRTLAIIFFDDEEQGLVGSRAFVNAYDNKTWEGGKIRLVAGLSMDPPGLNWPCVAGVYDQQVTMPFSLYQNNPGGAGDAVILNAAITEARAAGVPDSAIQVVNQITIAGPLGGSSDNAEFGRKSIPDLWIGGTTHLRLKVAPLNAVDVLSYPLHTPADNPETLFARCPGVDPADGRLLLAKGFEVSVKVVHGVARHIDARAGAMPRP